MVPAKNPNILFILMDDLGYTDLSCYGSSFYETPVLDRLACEGMRFTDGYASCPVCSPTRASVMTGKYPATVGITNWIPGEPRGRLLSVPYLHELPHGEVTIAQALKEAGYRTFHVGKWHLGGEGHYPEDFGFDANVAGCEWGNPRKGYFSPWHIPNFEDGVEGEYLTDHLTDRAIELIRGAGPRPWFLHLSHYAVHTPIQAPAELVRKYEDKARRLGLDTRQALVEGEYFPTVHLKNRRVMRRVIQSNPVYAAMVENFDTNIGRVLTAIEELGMTEDTLVVFTSDNGGLSTAEGSPTSNAPLAEGKGWMYDGGVREPLLVRWPRVVRPGSVCETPVTTPDFYPTFLEAAGLPPRPEQHCDGVSLMPLLRGHAGLDRDAIFWHYPHYSNQGGTPGCSVRCGDWKLIEFFEDGHLELYNLRDDISEDHNLAADRPVLVRELHDRLVAWREQVHGLIPEPNPNYAEEMRRDP
ncbi:MAG: sulfatase [Kiritimatiellaeota bacterium]|nr:sulfatase [Kiritimatiellota bacterium]